MFKKFLLFSVLAVLVFGFRFMDSTHNVDPHHSTISFSVPYGGLTKVVGKFNDFSGEFTYDKEDITKSTIKVKIDAKTIDTGIAQRDAHLNREEFLYTEKNPSILFESKKVVKEGDRYTITGDFTMRGVKKEISFPFTVSEMKDPSGKSYFGFNAKTKIKRSDWGVHYGIAEKTLSDMVDVDISLLLRPNGSRNTFVATP